MKEQIIIKVPKLNINEISYICDCVFNHFLDVDYVLQEHENISIDVAYNGKVLCLANSFFSKGIATELFVAKNLPTKLDLITIDLNQNKHELISFYGKNSFSISADCIQFDFDIIGASFFMLTRWEEQVILKRDKHNRMPANEAFAIKHNFIKRPIVNEYIDLIWDVLIFFGWKGLRKKYKFNVVPTHDVDRPYAWWNAQDVLRSIGGALLKRRNFGELKSIIQSLVSGKDLLDTHDLFMDLSEQNNLKSHFFFMTGGNSIYDNRYTIENNRIRALIENIKNREHNIGIHPSYNSYNNSNMFGNEKSKLEDVVNDDITTGRQHYLRFSFPTTWNVWNDNNMEWDSTLSFPDETGFRCGICYPFPVFDIVKRKALNLLEKPLIIMEGTYVVYKNYTLEQSIKDARELKQQVKKHNGDFVFLWHNSSFNTMKWLGYEPLLNYLYSDD